MRIRRGGGNGEITLSSDEEGDNEPADKNEDDEITLVTVRPKCKR